jgi:NAD(P)-dependent dehydrogenase (short-subunit alcohol dehydrogenase family)
MLVRFSAADFELFAAASHDRNPLHLSPDYARRTPYGRQVAYGILGVLAALAGAPAPGAGQLSGITVEFPRPIFPDVDYTLVWKDGAAVLLDGSTPLLKLRLAFTPGEPADFNFRPPAEMRQEAAPLGEEVLRPGLTRQGEYAPDPAGALRLFHRLHLDSAAWGRLPLAALLWSSYLAGMELPGERALFYRLVLRFPPAAPVQGSLGWRATLVSKNALNLLRSQVWLGVGEIPLAEGEVEVLLRPQPVSASAEAFVPSHELAGRVALITGASRGLGAAIARALAWRGATVLANFQHSRDSAERLAGELQDAPGSVVLCQGDAADPAWCRALTSRYPRLDFLILNACPTVLQMHVEPETIARINDYVARAFALVSIPLSAFAAHLDNRAVLISSAYVATACKEFPHYVAVKSAAEALLRVVAQLYRRPGYLIVRPPKLATDMTNTPFGGKDALAPAVVAERIAACLCTPAESGAVTIL